MPNFSLQSEFRSNSPCERLGAARRQEMLMAVPARLPS